MSRILHSLPTFSARQIRPGTSALKYMDQVMSGANTTVTVRFRQPWSAVSLLEIPLLTAGSLTSIHQRPCRSPVRSYCQPPPSSLSAVRCYGGGEDLQSHSAADSFGEARLGKHSQRNQRRSGRDLVNFNIRVVLSTIPISARSSARRIRAYYNLH